MLTRPKLVCCNFISSTEKLRDFALIHGFDGIDWSFTPENCPQSPAQESALLDTLSQLHPLEIRYHCAFPRTDLGDVDPAKADQALHVFRRICRLVSKLQGRYLTIHMGLGQDSTNHLSWNRSVDRLTELVHFANGSDVHVCLENLGWGWTSRPELYEKFIRKSGCWATLDIGHASVSPSIESQQYSFEDFVTPHPERFLSAHIYHREEGDVHFPPENLRALKDRLRILKRLPLCEWWVLELRDEAALLKTLQVVKEFLQQCSGGI